MKKVTLQDQYLLIKEGKGHKGVFLTEVKRDYPNLIRNAATFEEASKILKDKKIIVENIVCLQAINQMEPTKKQPFEIAYDNFLKEAKKKEDDAKAEEKKPSKQVEKVQEKTFDNKDMKNIDNLIFDQVMTGYYAELKDPANADKTMEELKEIVMKNLAKDPIHYTKDGQFGVKGLGYKTEHPGLGEPKPPTGPHKSSGYGNLNENKQTNMSINESKLRIAIKTMIREELSKVTINEITPNTSKLFNWFWGKHESAKEIQRRIREMSDENILFLYNNQPISKNNTPSNIQQSLLKKEIERRNIKPTSLNENLPKRLKEIENESIDEVKVAKLDKLKAEIEKRQSQLDMIEGNADLKDLTDGKKIKALQKEIKLLERAIAKLEKTIKGAKKEVIDETEEPSEEYLAAKQDAQNRYEEGEDIESILNDYPEFADMLEQDIIGGNEGMDY